MLRPGDHIDLDVDVAVKVVSTRASTPTSLTRFKREAQAAAKLRSPNRVQVLDYGAEVRHADALAHRAARPLQPVRPTAAGPVVIRARW